MQLNRNSIEEASRCLGRVASRVREIKATNASRLRAEYQSLVRGLQASGQLGAGAGAGDGALANPSVPEDVLRESVPGNIRKAEHFVAFLRRLVQHLRVRLNSMRNEDEET